MAKFKLPPYCDNKLAFVKEAHLAGVIKDLIRDVIIEKEKYFDLDDIEPNVEIIYPIVSLIIFNTHFWYVDFRNNEKRILNLVNYLVSHLL